MRSACSSVSPAMLTGPQHTLMRGAHNRSDRREIRRRARASQVLQSSRRLLRHCPCCAGSCKSKGFKKGERMGRFILGVIVGAAAVWFYGRDLIDYVDDKTRIARAKAADTLHSAAETLQGARETIDRRIS